MISKEQIASFIGKRLNKNRLCSHPWGYSCVHDCREYAIYERPQKVKPVVAALGSCIVKSCGPLSFDIYPDASVSLIRYRIYLKEEYFPGLIKGSKIMSYLMLPYLREVCLDKYIPSQRLCIFTDKGQIYHNYPSRSKDGTEGESEVNDISHFEESVIWDLPGRKYPSREMKCMPYESFFPNLPAECYELHPISNTDSGYKDIYGNGGFGPSNFVYKDGVRYEVSRFYLYSRDINANPFHFIGTGERNYKLNLIGTYRSNVEIGVRNCIFATSDGGRQWFCKYEFADTGDYQFRQGHTGTWGYNHGNAIRISNIANIPQNLQVIKRTLSIPSKNNPNPEELFKWNKVADVDGISTDSEGTKVVTVEPHLLETGNIVLLSSQDKSSLSDENAWFVNNGFSPCSLGNEKVFKVVVDSPYSFHIYELVSAPLNNIPCRHIHHLNPIKDGWIIGTGEIYPNGWILYFQNKKADTFSRCSANEDFVIIRLNSSEQSVQRTMGFLLKDDIKNSVIYASDHDTLERTPISLNGHLLDISRGSTGVYKGLLSDIDDRNQYQCVFESDEPCYYFQKLGDRLIFSGQRGDFAMSDLNAQTWFNCKLTKHLMKYYGNFYQYYIFDNAIIYFK